MSPSLGKFLDRMRKGNIGTWKFGLFAFLGAALAVNFFIHPRHPEYSLDNYPGYWALFGLLVAVAMILVMKKIVYPLLKRPEDKDDD